MVRKYEIRVLYALMTGNPVLSFRQLVMMNIWESRDSFDRKMIPHARLISCLLKMQGAIRDKAPVVDMRQWYFRLDRLNSTEWEYEKNARYHVLTDKKSGQTIRGIREDIDPNLADIEEEEQEGNVGGQVAEFVGHRDTGFEHPSGPSESVRGDISVEDFVQHARPPSYNRWSSYERMCWDRDVRANEEARRWRAAEEERHRQYAMSEAYAREQAYNNAFLFNEQQRYYIDYHAGQPIVEHPRPVEWTTLPTYTQGLPHQHWPQSQPSEWIPLEQPSEESSSGGGHSGAFDMRNVHYGLMESFFGPPLPRPPYDE